MADYRSKSYRYSSEMQIEPYNGPPGRRNDQFRSYSVSYTSSSSASTYYSYGDPSTVGPPQKLKKWKSRSWSGVRDPEFQRRKRVASYKVYSLEGKVKGSVRKSFRWLKDRYNQVVYGWYSS